MSGQPEHTTARHSAGYRPDCPACQWADANLMEPVERADIPLETYWTDRTAALAEALSHSMHRDERHGLSGDFIHEPGALCVVCDNRAKAVLLYLREHGWTLERAGE